MEKKTQFNSQFWQMCLGCFLFFISFNSIVPELPNFLTSIHGEKHKGLIISLFALMAMISRPFSGKIADTVGRIPVMIFGVFICSIIGFMYPIFNWVSGFFMLRFFHGFSTGFTPTGITAYIADVAPINKRGWALGIVGLSNNAGMALGNFFGGLLANYISITGLFIVSSIMGFLSLLCFWNLKETLKNPQKFRCSLLKVTRKDFFEPRVILPCMGMLLTSYSLGCSLTLNPDLAIQAGFSNKGILSFFYVLASLFIRITAGKWSDKYGRSTILKFSFILLAVAMCGLGISQTKVQYMLFSVLMGLAAGMNAPTFFAWATDLAIPEYKARAISTLFIFLEIGIMCGAYFSFLIYNGEKSNQFITFIVCSILSLLAFFLLFLEKKINSQFK